MRSARVTVLVAALVLLLAGVSSDARAEKRCDPVPTTAAAGSQNAGPWLTSSYSAGDPVASEEADPTAAAADPQCRREKRGRNECVAVTRQLVHYNGLLELARERDNELWEQSTQAHIDRLELRHERFCPQGPSGFQQFLAFLDRAATLAAKGAAKAFTQGAF